LAGYTPGDYNSGKNGYQLPDDVFIGIAPRRVRLSAGNQTTTRRFTFPVATGDRTLATIDGDQTFSGNVTLTNALRITAVSNQLVLGAGPNTLTINAAAAAGARTYTIPDPGGATASFILSTSTTLQSIAGLALTISTTTLTLPATVTYASAGSVVKAGAGALTLTNAGAAGLTFAGTGTITAPTGTYTLAGLSLANTFTAQQTINIASNQLVLNSGVNAVTLNTGTSAAARTYLFPDVGASATFAALQGDQTFTAIKRFQNGINITGGVAANSTLWFASNVLRARGGTAGFSFDNTSGTSIFSFTDGANAAGIFGPTSSTGIHRFNTAVAATSALTVATFWRVNINGTIRRIRCYTDA
jgi:hypothetical protein